MSLNDSLYNMDEACRQIKHAVEPLQKENEHLRTAIGLVLPYLHVGAERVVLDGGVVRMLRIRLEAALGQYEEKPS